MSRETAHRAEPIHSVEALVDYIRSGSKEPERLGIGLEHEKFGYTTGQDGLLVPIGHARIASLLDALAERHGWWRVYEGEHLIALERGTSAITLEPGGQLELAGSIFARLDDVAAELAQHLDEVLEVSRDLDIRWLTMGVRPFESIDEVEWMPKDRYRIMRRYMPTRGAHAHHMMKMTSTVQMNYDFVSEEDAAEMLRTVLATTAVASALFASSPFAAGQLSGHVTTRCDYWTDTDPDRSGYVRGMLEPGFTFRDYVDYLLDMPMFFIRRDNAYVDATGRTFRQFMAQGLGEHQASLGDWEVHMSTAFPEVRLKRYIEVRGLDCATPDMMMAGAALWKGLLYDREARRAAIALTEGMSFDERLALHRRMIDAGTDATVGDASLLELGSALCDIAARGLAVQARAQGVPDERDYLEPIAEHVLYRGASRAQTMVAIFRAHPGPSQAAIHSAIEEHWLTEDAVEMIRPVAAQVSDGPVHIGQEVAEHAAKLREDGVLDVLYVDQHLLAVNKPAGLASHAGVQHEGDNLTARLRQALEVLAVPYEEPLAPANRLDLEASGVVLFGLTPEARRLLADGFAQHTIDKVYLLVVSGRLRAKGAINRPLARGPREAPKPARTRYRTIATTGRFTLAKASAQTGRTHQVRRHMASIGHPLLGDTRYGQRKAAFGFRQQYGIDRIMLHARQVTLAHPMTGARLHIVASPGPEWDAVVAALGLVEDESGPMAVSA